jgi:hypothetical protein
MTERTVVTATSEPFLRVVRGNPSPDEVAALVAVFLLMREAETPSAQARRAPSSWSDPAELLRHPRHPRQRRSRL